MKAPPSPEDRRAPVDTLDDLDLQVDAVHDLTDPVDVLHEAPTDVLGERELPTGPALDPREAPTGPAEPRTAPWMRATPWANPGVPFERPRDPWFWPVFVFIVVLVGCIGVFVFKETHKVP